MEKIKAIIILFLMVVFFMDASCFGESVTLTTYYPAPSGSYKSLRTYNMCVGSTCANGTVEDNNLFVQGNSALGASAPGFAFQVGTGGSTLGMVKTGQDALIKGNLEVDGLIYGSTLNLTSIGADKQVLYNDGGTKLAGATNFAYDKTTGNVGIGLTEPGAELDIKGDEITTSTDFEPVLRFIDGSGTVFGQFYRDYNGTTEYLGLETYNSKPLILQEWGGNVGIGSTNPGAKLDVNNGYIRFGLSSGNGDSWIYARGTSANSSILYLGNGTYNVWNDTTNAAGGAMVALWSNGSFGNGKLQLWAGDDNAGGNIEFLTQDTSRMVVSYSGNVGIGETLPASKLDVNGNLGIKAGNGLRLYNATNASWGTVYFDGTNINTNYILKPVRIVIPTSRPASPVSGEIWIE